MSDVAHKGYEGSVVELRAMQKKVFFNLELEGTERNHAIFDFCVNQVAFEGTNVAIGRLERMMRECVADPEFYP